MNKIIVSLLVLIAVAGTTYYIVFKDLPTEEGYYQEESHEYSYMYHEEEPATEKTHTASPTTQTQAPTPTPTPTPEVTPAPTAVTVKIKNFSFSPSTLTIKAGTKVTWVNEDSAFHTITSNSGSLLNSGMISPGGSFTFTFTQAGSEGYHCVPHPFMKGTVVVAN